VKWTKRGLIFRPKGDQAWACHSAAQPTPILIDDDTIRIFVGFRDALGVTRLGYVDVAADEPRRVLAISTQPIFDIGRAGAFDDNGVILGDVIADGDTLRLYYVGFQLVAKVKFLAFSGLATSSDGGQTFQRQSQIPILGQAEEGFYIRAIHTVMQEGGKWKIWYAAGSSWQMIRDKPYPSYHIRYCESEDGFHFPSEGEICITTEGNEYRIGRPRVYRTEGGYQMFYTKGTIGGDYLPGYAESADGVSWSRRDDEIGLTLSKSGWDSQSVCYLSRLRWRDRVYGFYNGNDFGRTGFGYALLESS
jgi:predicted GH43/DUF377 family glycosyl hydrolase